MNRLGGGQVQEFRLVVPTVPVPQPRQRHTKTGVNYTPTKHPVNVFKATLIGFASKAGAKMMEGPLALMVSFYLPRPAKLMRRKDPDGPVRHTAKPDADNLCKSVKDALSKIVWHDDAQICSLVADKWYAGKTEQPRVEIVVCQLPYAREA